MTLFFKWSTFLTLTTPIFICNLVFISRGAETKQNEASFHCFCLPGYYEASTIEIYAVASICNLDSEELETSTVNNSTTQRLKICLPCWSNCKECVGAGDNACITCADGYFLFEPSSLNDDLLQSEQLLKSNIIEDSDEDEFSGSGPIESIQIFRRCVLSCPSGYTSSNVTSRCEISPQISLKNETNSTKTDIPLVSVEEEATPAGYYAIPPLVILAVVAVFVFSYLRNKRRRRSASNWRNNQMMIRKGSSAESKTFLSINYKQHQANDYRVGNHNVYVDRPLPHPLHRAHHGGSNTSSLWSGYEDDPDGLYETPEYRKHLYQKAVMANRNHHNKIDRIHKARSKSLDDCRHHNTKQNEKQRPTKPRSGSLESHDLPQPTKKAILMLHRNSTDPIEVPNHHAPPTPVRHMPITTKRRIHNDHIYVNVEDSA